MDGYLQLYLLFQHWRYGGLLLKEYVNDRKAQSMVEEIRLPTHLLGVGMRGIISIPRASTFRRQQLQHGGYEMVPAYSTEEMIKLYKKAYLDAISDCLELKKEAFAIFGLGAQHPMEETLDAIEWYDASIRALIEGDE